MPTLDSATGFEDETGRDGCVDGEDRRDKFKIWLDVMSGDREEEGGESRVLERDRS